MLLALSEGRDHDAYQLLCLDAVANGKSLENMKWYPGIRRNAPAIRFGIGIVYSGSRAVPSPEPIGHSGKSGAAGAPGMGPGMAPNMAGGPGGQQGGRNRQRTQRGYGQQQDPNQQQSKPELFKAPTEPAAMLAFYTGELGDKVLKNLRKRFDKGDFGLAMKEASKVRPAAAAVGGAPGGFPGGAMMPGGIPGPGAAMPGAAMPGAGGGAADVPAANGDQLQPGVTMLGEGKQSELLKAAAEEGIDVLIIYDIEVARGTVSPVNTTKIVLLNVSTKETIHSGSNLINGQVNKAREEKKRGGDPVDAEMERIFTVVDEKLAGASFPTNAKPDKVAAFVDKLADQKRDNPLPALAEIRFFRSKELITSEKMIEAYGKLLGPEAGEKAASGDAEAVMVSLAKWLPEKRPASLAENSGGETGEKKTGIFGKLFGK